MEGRRAAASSRWRVSRKEPGAPGRREAAGEARAIVRPQNARSVAAEPGPGSVDASLPRPGRLARSRPEEPERFGPIPGDYARRRTNQLRELMNIYDLG